MTSSEILINNGNDDDTHRDENDDYRIYGVKFQEFRRNFDPFQFDLYCLAWWYKYIIIIYFFL